jgi:predicted GNAT family acetyltransferase
VPESTHTEIRDNTDRRRYEISVGSTLAGFDKYSVRPYRVIITHTEVFDEFEGEGLAGKVIKFALDDIRARDLEVVPLCPFAAAYIDKHPEYADLVDHESMAILARDFKGPSKS